MTRPLALLLLLALIPVPAGAQQPAPIALTLQPMAAPVPALKYRLLPEMREQKTGNAALLYYRAFSPEWQGFRRDAKLMTNLGEVAEKPVRELRPAEVEEFAWVLNSRMLQELDRGARRSYCDWELTERVREEGISLLLPDLQGLREFGNLLALRAKEELLAGKYDQAARTLQTGLALARHLTEGPTLIHGLVAVRVAGQMLQVVDDWVERPDAPNLSWALASLPRPLLDLHKGFESERLFIDNLFPGYRELLANPAAPSPLEPVPTSLQRYTSSLAYDDGPRVNGPLLLALSAYPAAKRFLREHGRTAAQVEAMPALQAVFLYEIHQYDIHYDDLLKWIRLPYHEAIPQVRRLGERLKAESDATRRSSLAMVILPAVEKVVAAPARVERKVAALRCVEALRLHAAANGGQLPARLEDVTEVPLPLDPWNGKPFTYRLEDGKAILAGPPHAGEMPDRNNTLRYELTLRPARGDKEEKPPEAAAEDTKPEPDGQAAALAPLIDEETFALVRIDLSRVDTAELLPTLTTLLPNYRDELAGLGKKAKEFQTAFTRAGGTELVLVFSTADLPVPSFFQVPLKEGADVAALERLLKDSLGPRIVVEKRGKALVAGSKAALSRLAKSKHSPRAELAPALAAAGNAAVQALLLPTEDQRRVVEEVVTLPVPGGSGRTLTQGMRWAALGLDAGPKPAFALTLHAADGAAARKMADLIVAGFTLLGNNHFPSEEKPLRELLSKEFTAATEALTPMVAGPQVTIQVRDPAVLGALAALARGIEQYSDQERSVTAQDLKRILLALHRYLDANGTFPAQAICSKEGKPLLSWRVAILPYLEQEALYREFHLNEPWDSPNNKKLIARIPAVYRSPNIKDARPGLTTYLAPINKAFIFTGSDKGLQIKDIADGTSNTAMVVDAADEAGVIWTKPDDLVVNEKDPWKGLLGHYPNVILVGTADGSVRFVGKKVPGQTLWALFTRDGGEVLPDLSK